MLRRIAVGSAGLLLLTVWTACTGTDQEIAPDTPDASGADAGSGGDGASNESDGAAGNDADAEAVAGPFTVTVTGDGAVMSGVNVVISKRDGSYVDTIATDANGKASYIVDPGGMTFTVLYAPLPGSAHYALTVVDVVPGDDIAMRWDTRTPTTTNRTVNLALPPSPPPATASYRAFARAKDACSSTAAVGVLGFDLIVNETCASDLKTAIVVEALDSGGAPIAYAINPHVTIQTNQPTIAALGSEWVAVTPYNLEIVNLPQIPTALVYSSIVPISSNVPDEEFRIVSMALAPDGGAAHAPGVAAPVGLADALEHYAAFFVEGGAANQWQKSAVQWRHAPTADATIDFMTDALPGVGPAVLDLADSARPKMSWQTGVPLTMADGATTAIAWTDAASAYHKWSFYLPPSATFAQVPVIPASLGAWKPTPGVTYEPPGVVFSESDAITGYRDFVKVVEEQSVGFGIGPYGPSTLRTNQRLRISAYGKGTPQ